MRNAGRRSDVAATTWSTSATPNRPSPGRYSGARAQWSRTNRSGSPTQRRSALPVGAVGIPASTAVRDVDAVGPVGAVDVVTIHVVGVVAVAVASAVGDVGAVHAVRAVGPVGVRAVSVAAAGGVDVVGVARPRAGGAALRGGDVVVSEMRVVSAHAGLQRRTGSHAVDGRVCPASRNLPPASGRRSPGIGAASGHGPDGR